MIKKIKEEKEKKQQMIVRDLKKTNVIKQKQQETKKAQAQIIEPDPFFDGDVSLGGS